MRIKRREDHRLSSQCAKILRTENFGHDVLGLAGAPVVTRELAAVDDIRVKRVRHNVAILFRRYGMPLANGDFAVIATAGDADRTALLLAAAEPIRESVVRIYMIELGGGLVVPRAPAFTAVDGDDCALVVGQQDDTGIVGVESEILIVVAARRAAEACPGLGAVG